MNEGRKELLAYCGLYCGYCMGYTGVIVDNANNLKTVLEKHKFDQTAKHAFLEELKDYDKFFEILKFMTGLKCPMICREREDDNIACEVRKCCIEKGYYACYECNDFENCEKIKSIMGGLHADSCIKNLKAIKKMGLDDWIAKGEKIWYWCETNA